MKKLIMFSFLISSLFSCTKVKIAEEYDFNIAANKTTYSTTDTVVFQLTGNPGYITFYSGEAGKRYEYAKTTERNADSTILTFSTNTTAAGATTQPLAVNNVSVFVSTNFSGIMDSLNIKKAIWTDISSRAVFATTTTTVSSGRIHMEDLKKAGEPIYVAFKYMSDTTKTNYLPRKWVIPVFTLNNYFKDVVYPLAGGTNGTTNPFMTGGFQEKSILNSTSNWVFANTSLTFNAAATIGNLPDEDWSVSRPFDLTLYPSDLGVGIKNPTVQLKQYKYRFTKAGVYVVTFVAKNSNAEVTKETIRQVTVTVQ